MKTRPLPRVIPACLGALALGLTTLPVWALKDDDQQPMLIEAD